MAAKALVTIGSESAMDALIRALKNGDESVREIAAKALEDKSAILILTDAENDSCESVQKAARESLEKMKLIK